MATRRRKKTSAGATAEADVFGRSFDESPRGDSDDEQQGELAVDELDEQLLSDESPPAVPVAPPSSSAPEDRRMPPPWGNVISDVFSIDIEVTYNRLTHELSLGSDVTQYGAVLSALDVSARNAFDAVRLARAAKRKDEDVAREIDERLEVLRSTARELLESEKKQQKKDGATVKAATLQEIKDRMVATWPDEMQSLETRKSYMHGAFRSIEGLEKAWWDRCQSLRKIADRFTAAAR